MATIHIQPSRPAPIPVLPEPIPIDRRPRARFSEELRRLARLFAARPARLSELLEAKQDRWGDLLPLPIPLTNTLPAFTIVLLAAAAMERDGLFFLAGCGMFALTLAFFGLLAFGGAHLLEHLRHTVFGS